MDLEKITFANDPPPVPVAPKHRQTHRFFDDKYHIFKLVFWILLVSFVILASPWFSSESNTKREDVAQSYLQDDDALLAKSTVLPKSKAEVWEEKQGFCNVVGSQGDHAVYDKEVTADWIEAYREILGIKGDLKCANSACNEKAEVGGHIVKAGQPVSPSKGANGVFLVPLCYGCNGITEVGKHLDSKTPATAVMLNNYCNWPGHSCATTNISTKSNCGEKDAQATPMPE